MGPRPMSDDPLQISYYATDWRASVLSNMTPTPMVFDGVYAACVEAVVQSMNFPMDDPRHESTLHLSGPVCKSMIYEAESVVAETGLVYWNGGIFEIDSDDRLWLLDSVIRAKFATNKLAWEALRLSEGRTFEYNTSELDERLSIPTNLFLHTLSSVLDDIRAGLLPAPSNLL